MPAASPGTVRAWARASLASLLALVVLELLWEVALAPLRPGGSWLAWKALPLALFLPAVARGSLRARQWLALLLPFYLAEAIVRGWSESGRHALVAWAAAALAVATFVTLFLWVRAERGMPSRARRD